MKLLTSNQNYKVPFLIYFLLLFQFSSSFAQNCRTIVSNDYDADTDMEYEQLIGGIIHDDGAKALMTGFQDIFALYAGKTSEGEVLVYLQHTRYVDNDNSTARDNLSIKEGNELIIRGDFGKINLTAYKDQSPSTEVKGFTGQTKNKICQVYTISQENLELLCSGLITTLIINYDTAPKIIKKIKEKKAKKHLKFWSCAPKKLN